MKLLLKILLPLLVLAGVGFFLLNRLQPKVEVAPAEIGTAVDAVTGTVEIYANIDILVKTEVPGVVKEVPVERGQKVEEGDVLAEMDSTDIELELKQRRIQLDFASQRLELPYPQAIEVESAEIGLERLEQMVRSGAASTTELEERKRDLEKTRIFLENEKINRAERKALLEVQVEQLEERLKDMTVRAPWDGEVVEIRAWPGNYLYGGNPVARMISPGRWVEMVIAEEDAYGVSPGQKAEIRLAGQGNEMIPATVSSLSLTADAEKKSRSVFLTVDKDPGYLVPGFTGEGVLIKQERDNTVVIPRRALIGNIVFVVKDGVVERRQVQPGFLSLNKAEILSGLEEGELVVLERQNRLENGQNVEPVSPTR